MGAENFLVGEKVGPAKILVVLVKDKGAPILVPVKCTVGLAYGACRVKSADLKSKP